MFTFLQCKITLSCTPKKKNTHCETAFLLQAHFCPLYLRTHFLSVVDVLCSGHPGTHLLCSTSRATLQALQPSAISALSEDLQPVKK